MTDYENARIQKLFKLLASNKLLLRDEASRSLLAAVRAEPTAAAQVTIYSVIVNYILGSN